MSKLTKDEKEDAKRLYKEWEDALAEESDAASRATLAEDQLQELGIDPNSPPDWLI